MLRKITEIGGWTQRKFGAIFSLHLACSMVIHQHHCRLVQLRATLRLLYPTSVALQELQKWLSFLVVCGFFWVSCGNYRSLV